ncbi:MAG: DNA polymerase III subunit gamma/tau [Candidatus Eisenbacteria bacterium]|nr:DNA polymerase III subunit gamma/tau [Candidatus Eisenbacteria bacterium]
MAYVVLARKWRPQRFEDVVGQEHITGTLANAISQNRVAHGYLFCGPRGVGKTTTARILAKALNCEKGPTPTPCNQCSVCRDVDQGTSFDILEVDGASTRGIDDIRELRDNVRYTPAGGRTKVYIIDEVHMLTREAFNALLKTLEEPPPHVVFVMATTEAFKVPATILSRCQRFDFARIHPRAVVGRLKHICQAEGITIDDDAVAILARRSAGGLRDALSSLDQVLASSPDATDIKITEAMVDRVLGILSSDFYFGITDRLIDGDAAGALQLLDDAWHGGADLSEVTEEMARHFRNVMVTSISAGSDATLDDLGPHEIARLREQAGRLSPTAAARLLEVSLRTLNLARRSEQIRLHLEISLVELSQVSRALSLGEVAKRLSEMEQRLGGAPPMPAAAPPGAPAAAPRATAPATPLANLPPTPPSTPAEPVITRAPGDAASLWKRAVGVVMERRKAIGFFLAGSQASGFDAGGKLIVAPDSGDPMSREHLEDPDNRRYVEEVLRELSGAAIKYRVEEARGPSSKAVKPAAKVPAPVTPESIGSRPPSPAPDESSAAVEAPATSPMDHPIIQKALELFDGEITS